MPLALALNKFRAVFCEIRGGLLAQIILNEGLRFLKAATVRKLQAPAPRVTKDPREKSQSSGVHYVLELPFSQSHLLVIEGLWSR
jgi:hypothetical protein